MTVNKVNNKNQDTGEVRSYYRDELLGIWNVSLVIPSLGKRSIPVKDITENGLAFYSVPGSDFAEGDEINSYIHISEKIRFPLAFRVVHTFNDGQGDRIGCEITDRDSRSYRAYRAFVQFLHYLSEIH